MTSFVFTVWIMEESSGLQQDHRNVGHVYLAVWMVKLHRLQYNFQIYIYIYIYIHFLSLCNFTLQLHFFFIYLYHPLNLGSHTHSLLLLLYWKNSVSVPWSHTYQNLTTNKNLWIVELKWNNYLVPLLSICTVELVRRSSQNLYTP